MKCIKCGRENKDGAKYCASCGSNLKKSNGRKGKAIIIIVLVIGLVLVAGIAGFFYVRQMRFDEYTDAARAYMDELNYEGAEMAYVQALDIKPGEETVKDELIEVYIQDAEAAIGESDYERAERACQSAGELEDSNEKANLLMGDIYLSQGARGVAREQYQKELEINPYSSTAYMRLLSIEISNEEYDKADQMVSQAEETPIAQDETFLEYVSMYANYQRYAAYQEIIQELESNARGRTAVGITWEQSYGFCFSRLVDFDGNGTKEMIIIYTESPYTQDTVPAHISDYVIEVWDYENGEVKKVFSGKPFVSRAIDLIYIAEDGEKCYLRAGEDGTYYKYENGEFISDETLETNADSYTNHTYILQGDKTTYNGKTYKSAYEEIERTEEELSYLERACYQSIINMQNRKATGAWIAYGNYSYRSEELDMYVCSYPADYAKKNPTVYVNYFRRDESHFGSGYWHEFVWDDNDAYGEDDGYTLSYVQEEDAVEVVIYDDSGEETVRAELTRETQYDIPNM